MKKILLALLVVGIAAVGYLRWSQKAGDFQGPADAQQPAAQKSGNAEGGAALEGASAYEGLVPAEAAPSELLTPAPFRPVDNTLIVEISEYAGYAGLIAANGGRLEPNEDSYFFKNHGFKVRIKVSESESWSPLNSGKIAAATSTVDVLAVYANQLSVVVPVQLGFSRGADAIVVRQGIRRINDLRGKTVLSCQFTEGDFFLRFLADEAGIPVNPLNEGQAPKRDAINVRYADEAFTAGDIFMEDLNGGANAYAGVVTWEPKVGEVVRSSGGKASILVSNRNLLVIADILMVNKPFAQSHPEMVDGLVAGILTGNQAVRESPEAHFDMLNRAFKWSPADSREELSKIHFSNHPENVAFFSGAIDAAGSFGGIYQSALFAYDDLVQAGPGWERFLGSSLENVAPLFAGQVASIVPIKTRESGMLEENPLLTRDIRFFFEPNSAVLEESPQNGAYYVDIKRMLQVSPGSRILLRGHVDGGMMEEFRKQGGEPLVRRMALSAMELSRQRANAVRERLVQMEKVDPTRLEVVGRGWEEPAGTSDENRRVEVYWFTLE